MGKIILIGVAALSLQSPNCSQVREFGNRFKSFAKHFLSMPEPGASAFKQRKTEEPDNKLKGVKIAPVENYKYSYTFGNGDKLYVDKKRGMAKVVGADGDIVVEGKTRKFPDKQIIVLIDDPKDEFEVGFRKDGFMLLIPKLDTERVISR